MITVYVLQGDKRRYVGLTNDLQRRLNEHKNNNYVAGNFALLHTELFPDYASARIREKFLKSGKGREFLQALYSKPRSARGG